MTNFTSPNHSKSRVKAVGKRIRGDNYTLGDISVLENWRASHSYILNTFQANLRNRARQARYAVTVAQRLKRRHTIFDKLRREPNMQLSTMHDIAGCRLVFDTELDLLSYREKMHEARFNHVLRTKNDPRYNYIENPKSSGYRGIHDVYEYKVRSAGGEPWNGLLIEIQYRTRFQHAWATAVEVADLITTNRLKFSEGDENHTRFFQIASEIISRAHEGRASCLADLSPHELCQEFKALDRRLGLLATFDNLRQSQSRTTFKKNTILIFRFAEDDLEQKLTSESFENINRAVERYDQLEKLFGDTADIVLVRGETEESIRYAFRNYFSDAREFVDYVRDGLEIIEMNAA
ncbi:MAG: RelA/SpoT domain-containing protein [Pseudomonadota bacterium]